MYAVFDRAPEGNLAISPKYQSPVRRHEDTDRVKSAARVLDILHFFKVNRRPGRCKEIAAALDIPVSSTNELLKTLVSTGYLLFDDRQKEYFPSPMVYTLGNWWRRLNSGAPRFMRALEEIVETTGESATLSIRNRWSMQIVAAIPGRPSDQPGAVEGEKIPLISSAAGIAMLATRKQDEVVRLVRRSSGFGHNETNDGWSGQSALDAVDRCRRFGYFARDSLTNPALRELARALPREAGEQPMVICIEGPADDVRRKEPALLKAIRGAIERQIDAEAGHRLP